MAFSLSNSEKIILKSSDDNTFEVHESVTKQSVTIKHMIKEPYVGSGSILILNVSGESLASNIEYCKRIIGYKWLLFLACKSLLFNIKSDFTLDEEAKIQKENPWAWNNN
ncbi:hypothetical protein M9H77_29823 [Catharanthus roseus]|uniref:Uncharacterized protein n=1 Tax=Catharanthus roseus TaxID=4058 RepID=A0ACB9ZZD9_CATRO|nr:hypothetical protein M9H77_29823 [Catharanthus roseus]